MGRQSCRARTSNDKKPSRQKQQTDAGFRDQGHGRGDRGSPTLIVPPQDHAEPPNLQSAFNQFEDHGSFGLIESRCDLIQPEKAIETIASRGGYLIPNDIASGSGKQTNPQRFPHIETILTEGNGHRIERWRGWRQKGQPKIPYVNRCPPSNSRGLSQRRQDQENREASDQTPENAGGPAEAASARSGHDAQNVINPPLPQGWNAAKSPGRIDRQSPETVRFQLCSFRITP